MTVAPLALFRTDAGLSMGAGHLVRCGALAQTLTGFGWRTFLMTRPDTRKFMPLTEGAFETVEEIDTDTEGLQIVEQISAKVSRAVVVIDGYTIPHSFEVDVSRSLPIVIFDDVPERPHKARLLVDPTPGRQVKEYAALTPANCEILTGPSHAILRTPFRRARKPRSEEDPRRNSDILVVFGATDPQKLLAPTVQSLRNALPNRRVNVVCGKSAAEAFHSMSDQFIQVNVDADANHIAQLMDECALVVGAAGSGSWERCVCALPSVVVSIADNQEDIANGLRRSGAAEVLPLEAFRQSCAEVVSNLLASGARYSAMSAAAVKLCDGLGATRVAKAIDRIGTPVEV